MERKFALLLTALLVFVEGFNFTFATTLTKYFAHAQKISVSRFQYAYISIFIIGMLVSLFSPKLGKKTLFFVFILGVLNEILAIFFLGATALAFYIPLFNVIFFSFSFLTIGLANGLLVTILPKIINGLFPMNIAMGIVGFFTFSSLGDLLATYLLRFSDYYVEIGLGLSTIFLFFLILSDVFKKYTHQGEPLGKISARIWLFFLALVLIGILEIFGLSLAEKTNKELDFWALYTIGRIVIALFLMKFSYKWIYLGLPLMMGILSLVYFFTGASEHSFFLSFCLLQSSLFPLAIGVGKTFYPEFELKAYGKLSAGFWAGISISLIFATKFVSLGKIPITQFYLIVAAIALLLLFVSAISLYKKTKIV